MPKLIEAAAALLAAQCEAVGVDPPAATETPDDWCTRLAKDEIMKHDLVCALDAAARFDVVALSGALHSVQTFFDHRDQPIVRRAAALQGDR